MTVLACAILTSAGYAVEGRARAQRAGPPLPAGSRGRAPELVPRPGSTRSGIRAPVVSAASVGPANARIPPDVGSPRARSMQGSRLVLARTKEPAASASRALDRVNPEDVQVREPTRPVVHVPKRRTCSSVVAKDGRVGREPPVEDIERGSARPGDRLRRTVHDDEVDNLGDGVFDDIAVVPRNGRLRERLDAKRSGDHADVLVEPGALDAADYDGGAAGAALDDGARAVLERTDDHADEVRLCGPEAEERRSRPHARGEDARVLRTPDLTGECVERVRARPCREAGNHTECTRARCRPGRRGPQGSEHPRRVRQLD